MPVESLHHVDTPSRPPRAAGSSHRQAWIVASIGAAVTLNLLAISAFAAVTDGWQTPPGEPQRTPWITVVELNRAVPIPPEPPHAPSLGKDASLGPPAPTPPMAPSPGAAQLQHFEIEAATPVRYYRSDEVERPAEPESDWNLDAATLDTVGAEVLVFDIFIGRDGEVLRCVVLTPETLTDEARRSVEERLRETIVRPAVRGGATVASVRRIEVSVLPSER